MNGGDDNAKDFFFLLFSLYFLLTSTLSYALPFNIVPKAGTQLPTTLVTGNPAIAYYTVTNLTGSQRNNNFLKYLPPNVTQVTSGGTYPDTCGSTFNLSPLGQLNDSCTLQLSVSGAVNANDPDPHHHLFACFPGGITCAGTLYPLNVANPAVLSVTITPTSATISRESTQQFRAVAHFKDGSQIDVTSVATWSSSNPAVVTISSSGLATGVNVGTSLITATFRGVTSNFAVVNVTRSLVSIAITPTSATIRRFLTQQYAAMGTYDDGSTQDITTSVNWNSSNTNVATISSSGLATGIGAGITTITASSGGITSNAASLTVVLFIYITNTNFATIHYVSYCSVNTDGSLGLCTQQSGFNSPFGAAINPANTRLFVTNRDGNDVSSCPINADGTLGACFGTGGPFFTPEGIAINPAGTIAYIVNATNNNLSYCSINGTFALINCTSTGSITSPRSVAINAAGTFAYITHGNSVTYCTIDGSSSPAGALTNCQIAQNLGTPTFGITIAVVNGTPYAYIASPSASTIYYCSFNSDGSFNTCNTATTGVSGQGIAINPEGTIAYIATGSGATIQYCPINNDGTITASSCNLTGSGFTNPQGLALS